LQPDLHPISQGASMCCDSLHKTMPDPHGAALLHIGGCALYPPASRDGAFASTSPSYLILLSIDRCIDYIQTAAAEDFALPPGWPEPSGSWRRRGALRCPPAAWRPLPSFSAVLRHRYDRRRALARCCARSPLC
jgi:hypothetical protein